MSVGLKPKILIVEDHQQLADNLFEYLGEEKYELDYAADGLTALHLLANNVYDIVVLDIMLPGIDGLMLCKRIREDLHSSVPIIMLTARDSIEDKTHAFTLGADDYLVKPFHMRELELRIQAQCRRSRMSDECVSAADMHYYPGSLTLVVANKPDLVLSGYSASLFNLLIKRYPNYVTYSDLSECLWGNPDGDAHSIRTHVYSLRKILKEHLGCDVIKTLHGRGYCLIGMSDL